MSGAEISRVEDTIRRICAAYGIRQSHIFSIASCIIVTLETKDHKMDHPDPADIKLWNRYVEAGPVK